LDTCTQRAPASLAIAFFYAGTLIVSLTTFRPVASFFNGSDTLYLLAVLLLIIRLLHEGQSLTKVFIYDNPFFKPLLVFIFGAILSLINSSDLTAAATVMGKYIFLFGIWLPAGIYLLNTPKRIKWMLIVLIVAALVPLIPAIGDYYFQTQMTIVIDQMLDLNLEHASPHDGRFGSVMGHPNNFGFMVVVIFPVSLWLVFFAQSSLEKICGLLFLCLLIIGSLTTASRSTALALSIQIFFFVAFIPQHSFIKRVSKFLVLLILIGGISTVTIISKPVIIVDRFIQMASHEIGDYEPDLGRIDFMVEAWRAIVAHPVAGLGVENTASSSGVIGVHNTILRLWAGIGVWGLIFISWIYFRTFHEALANLKKAIKVKSRYAPIYFLLLTSAVGWFFVDMVQPQFYDRFKIVTLILLFSLSGMIKTEIDS
jgi:hypothetical protein